MEKLGPNVKFRIGRGQRDELKRVMRDAFGVEAKSSERFEIFDLEGTSLGAELVDDVAAPEPAFMKDQGTWLEVVVDDPVAVREALAKHGIRPFEYFDKTHAYVQLPGGQVVRVSKRA